jgi:hypothetical protein
MELRSIPHRIRESGLWTLEQSLSLFCDHVWHVGILEAPLSTFNARTAPAQIEWVPYHARDSYLADPFLLKGGRRIEFLAEQFQGSTGRGRIVHIIYDRDTSELMLRPAIEGPYHLSFPYVVHDENGLYCIPECAASRELCAYRHDPVTGDWIKASTLLSDFPGVDSIIFQVGTTYWLVSSVPRGPRSADLRVFNSDSLLNGWREDPSSPVVNVDFARSAGAPFLMNGVLFRFTQDSTRRYGHRIAIKDISSISMGSYTESTLCFFDASPSWPYNAGIHTVNHLDGITVIDALSLSFAPQRVCCRVSRKLRRLWALSTASGKCAVGPIGVQR